MSRGARLVACLAVVCLVTSACAIERLAQPTTPSAGPAIALSVLSDRIYTVDPATGERHAVVAGLANFQSGYAVWAPDHLNLAYGNGGIWEVDTATSSRHLLIGGGSLSMPTFGPAGAQLTYGDGLSLWVASLGPLRAEHIKLTGTLAPVAPDWSVRTRIAFEGVELDCSLSFTCPATDRSEIWSMAPDGSNLKRLTSVGHAENPKWSPDGSHVLFVRRQRTPAGILDQLWGVASDGTGLHRMVAGDAMVAADWSPDGTRLVAVTTGPGASTLQVWTGPVASNGHVGALTAIGGPVPGTAATIDW
jgi:Tol biopolymer transport system component